MRDEELMALLPWLEVLAQQQDVTKLIPELNEARRKEAEGRFDTAKTADSDVPPVAKVPWSSPPSHRGFYNSLRTLK